jgi:hypothetical protein
MAVMAATAATTIAATSAAIGAETMAAPIGEARTGIDVTVTTTTVSDAQDGPPPTHFSACRLRSAMCRR